MAELQNINRLANRLQALVRKHGSPKTVVVGFTQNYALYVHENLEAKHRVGQAKYLEQPARQNAPELGRIVKDAVTHGATVDQGMLLAGLRLQRESQELVPIDTSALKNSAFTTTEDQLEQASAAAYARGEAIRRQGLAAREAQQ